MPINRYDEVDFARDWNKKYREYHPYLHGRQRKVLDLITSLGLPTGASCLELGCGGGQNAVKYAELGLQVHGVDSSAELVKSAQELAQSGTNLTFSQVDLNTRLPFEDASFDVVVTVGVLQYLLEPSACVKEASRILKPGGHLVVCQRNAISFHFWRRPLSVLCCLLAHEGFEWGGRGGVIIKRMVKLSNLSRWMRNAGLQTIYRGGYTPDFSMFPRLFRALNSLLNTIPFMYRFSFLILAAAKKPAAAERAVAVEDGIIEVDHVA